MASSLAPEAHDDVQDCLTCLLKNGTAKAHAEAERVHFVREFIRGRVPREIYQHLIVNLHYVYTALEESLDACWEHELLEPLYFPDELRRTPSLHRDAEYFLGEAWKGQSEPSEATRAYVQRIREVAQKSPELLLSHAYTRYLGDLSGGQTLARAAQRGMKLPEDGSGVHFFKFKRIPDTEKFKNMYRALLDSLTVSKETATRLVMEANAAFAFNIRLFEELDVMLGLESRSLQTAPPSGTKLASIGSPACPFANMGLPLPVDHPPLRALPKAALQKRPERAPARRASVLIIALLVIACMGRRVTGGGSCELSLSENCPFGIQEFFWV